MRDHDDGGDHGRIDQNVLHHRDHRRRAQPTSIGVGGEDDEGDDERPFTVNAQTRQHHFHADKLQCDVGHCGDDAGDRNGEREAAAAEASAHEIGAGYIALRARHAPEPREGHEHEHIGDGRHRARRKKPVTGTGAEHQRRHSDEGIGGVEIAAEQKPGDDRAEATPAQSPFRDLGEIALAPARGEEAEPGDEQKQREEDDQRGAHEHRSSRPSAR